MSATEILEQIRRLPLKERTEVLEKVREEFFEGALSPEQVTELDRRAEDALRQPGRGTPVAQVSAAIRKRILRGK